MWLAALGVAVLVVASVTFRPPDTDVWQHLAVGRAIWSQHRVPTTQLWTWPTYGAPDVNASWGFRVLIWPLWNLAGVWGLFAWRWLSALVAFSILWLTARRMGARGFGPLAVAAISAAIYRYRSQVRPETLVAILLAIEIWILESRRHGSRDRSAWLPLLALVWANCHISYFLFFVVLGAHVAREWIERLRSAGSPANSRSGPARVGTGPGPATGATSSSLTSAPPVGSAGAAAPARPPRPVRLVAIGAASLVAMLINPWGWRALAQPFLYWFVWRKEPIFTTIGELGSLRWEENLWNGLPIVALATPVFLIWRWRRRGPDIVEMAMLGVFATLGFISVRFLGAFALVLVPYLGRDLDEWLAARRWPAWTARPLVRALAVGAVALAAAIPMWATPGPPMGVGLDLSSAPVAACDFIERQGVRGRSFNIFEFGGYLLYRFWPQRDRLPFMDIHQAGTPEIRLKYALAFAEPRSWEALDREFSFEWILLRSHQLPGDELPLTLARDTSLAIVFLDDVSVLYVRRAGHLTAIADANSYRLLGATGAGRDRLVEACSSDTALRSRVRLELERVTRESAASAEAHADLARLDTWDGHPESALAHQRAALAADPGLEHGQETLGDLALAAHQPREALVAYARAAHQRPRPANLDLRMGDAWRDLGEARRARAAYDRELKRDPGNAAARAALERLGVTVGEGGR